MGAQEVYCPGDWLGQLFILILVRLGCCRKTDNSRGHSCPVGAPRPSGSCQASEAPQGPQITAGEGVFILRTQGPILRVLIAAAIWWRRRGSSEGPQPSAEKVGEPRGAQSYPGRVGPAQGWSHSRRTRSPPHCLAPHRPPLLLLGLPAAGSGTPRLRAPGRRCAGFRKTARRPPGLQPTSGRVLAGGAL